MSLVLFDRRGDVASVTLNRPDKRNALSAALASELRAALAALASSDAPPRALVLSGAGPVFCAGGDLEAMSERIGKSHETIAAVRSYLNSTVLAVARFPAPTIAAVHGAAIGAGWGLALACDHVHVTADAKLAAGQTGIGLVPDAGLSFFLPRAVGDVRAMELLQSGRTITGAEAVALGLATAAHPDAKDLEAAVTQAASALATRPTMALVAARRLVRDPGPSSLEEALEAEAVGQGMAYATRDLKEGVEAATVKRRPSFVGR